MKKIEFVGKSLLIEEEGTRILVIGDLHLGYEEGVRRAGLQLPLGIYKRTISELEEIFNKLRDEEKKIDIVVLLGDLKHEMGRILGGEWREVGGLIDYLNEKTKKIVIIRGNHDVMTSHISDKKGISIENYFIFGECCFLHGDRDFEGIHDKKIKTWVMGHFHPAVDLEDGAKSERYKCFLVGKYSGKEVIIVPSFFGVSEGIDPRESEMKSVFGFNIDKFDVRIVGEKLEVLDFGKLENLD